MFGPAGHLYTYFTYGMHWCANIVCGVEGQPTAVLLRAGEIVDGLDAARERRHDPPRDRDLARGPARLAQALGLGRGPERHRPLRGRLVGPARLDATATGVVVTGPRVGITVATERPWRFWLDGDPDRVGLQSGSAQIGRSHPAD